MGIRTIAAALAVFAAAVSATAASAETRSLKLYHVNSHESWDIPYKSGGRYLPDGLKKLNHALRDWRTGQETKMDPRLLDAVWTAWKQSGSRGPIHVIGGYRSPGTNSMLRSRSSNSGVAENSQHVKGRAMDFFIPDVPLRKMREIGLRLQAGGVGYYPSSGSPFVHLDVGSVRHWPRMSRKELVAVFPNGGTIHVPSDGRPLPGYEQAMAAYKARGGAPAATVMMADAGSSAEDKPSFLASLFGGRRSGSEKAVADVRKVPVAVAAKAAPAEKAPVREVPVPVEKAPVPEVVPVEVPAEVLVAARVPVPSRAPSDHRLAEAVRVAEASAPRIAAILPSKRPEPDEAFAALLARRAETPVAATALAYGTRGTPSSSAGSLRALDGLVAALPAAPTVPVLRVPVPVSFDPAAPVLSLSRVGQRLSSAVDAADADGKSSRVRRANSIVPPAPTALFAYAAQAPDPARFGDAEPEMVEFGKSNTAAVR